MDLNRKAAFMSLMDVEVKKAFSNIALNNNIQDINPASPAFVRELVYGVLENRLLLDHMIERLVPSGLGKIKADALTLLRMGIYQIEFMDSVPEYAAVNETVSLAKKFAKGRDGFINAVLRSYMKQDDRYGLPVKDDDITGYLSLKYSYAPWIVEMCIKEYGEEKTCKILASGNETPDMTIRVNRLKTTKEKLKKELIQEGFNVSGGSRAENALKVKGSSLLESESYKKGMFSVQDEASMLTAEILGALPGETVMDVCAAPGGKTMAIAEIMNNSGRIYASDFYEKKLRQIEKGAKRLGIDIIRTKAWDATETDHDMTDAADRVLVDAPCSGLGVIRKKPEIKYREYEDDLKKLPEKQLGILTAAAEYVKPGGVLVYSTCTINPFENRMVTSGFLMNNDKFKKEEELQLLPGIDETDGFYICRMRKE